MKVSTMLRSLFVAAIAVIATATTAQAQESATVNGFGVHAGTQGIGIQYAITPSIQIGGTFALASASQDIEGSDETRSATALRFAPWMKFLLEGVVNPYFIVGVGIETGSTSGTIAEYIDTQMAAQAGFGLMYYLNRNFGVGGSVNLAQIALSDDIPHIFGVYGGQAGVEVFF